MQCREKFNDAKKKRKLDGLHLVVRSLKPVAMTRKEGFIIALRRKALYNPQHKKTIQI